MHENDFLLFSFFLSSFLRKEDAIVRVKFGK